MTLAQLKNDIILQNGLRYYDFTASGLALNSIETKLNQILPTYANTHSDNTSSATITAHYYNNAKLSLHKSLELDDDFVIIACGYGSTAAIKKLQEILGIYAPPALRRTLLADFDRSKSPYVVVGPYEHHSNELSFMHGVCECVRVGLSDGVVDYFGIERALKGVSKSRLKLLSFSAASNVTGIRTDIKRLSDIARKHGALLALDCSTSIAYENAPCKLVDAIYISGHKLLGGVGGCGLLVMRKSIIKQYLGGEPSFAAGGTVDYVSRRKACFVDDVVALEEGGTLPILQLIKTAYAFEYRNAVGLELIKSIERKHCFDGFTHLARLKTKINGLRIYAHNVRDRLPIFAINIDGIDAYALAHTLSQRYGIQTRAGCSCAGPYGHELLELKDHESKDELGFVPGWLRFGFHYTHDEADLEYFFECLYLAYKSLTKA